MKRMFTGRRLILLIVGIVTVGLRIRHVGYSRPALSASTVAEPGVATTAVHRSFFDTSISVAGHVGGPSGEVAHLAFPQAGIIRRIMVHNGDNVTRGTELAELDRAALAAAVTQAQAAVDAVGNVDAARSKEHLAAENLRAARRGITAATADRLTAQSQAREAALKTDADIHASHRAAVLFAAGVIAEKDLRAAQDQATIDRAEEHAAYARLRAARQHVHADTASATTDVLVARGEIHTSLAQRAVAAAQLQAAQLTYAQGILRAPSDGIVAAIDKHVGESVDPNTPVVEIVPATRDTVTLDVPYHAVQTIHPGDPVTIRDDDESADGTVRTVAPMIDTASQTVHVTVEATLQRALVGSVVHAVIRTGHSTGIVVPSSAVVADPETGKTVVFVRNPHPSAQDPAFMQREVRVGASDGGHALIMQGLRVGERIATEGAFTLLAATAQ